MFDIQNILIVKPNNDKHKVLSDISLRAWTLSLISAEKITVKIRTNR